MSEKSNDSFSFLETGFRSLQIEMQTQETKATAIEKVIPVAVLGIEISRTLEYFISMRVGDPRFC